MAVVNAVMIGTTLFSGWASNRASKAEQKGIREGLSAEERIADKNLAFQKEMTDQQREDFAPWREVGEQALNSIWEGVQSGAFEIGKINLEDDPGYRVRMEEGPRALDASAASRGRLVSGAHDKATIRYGQEQGSKEYANAYARAVNERNTKFNILSGLSSGGRAAAAGQAGATSRLATTSGDIYGELGRSKNIARIGIGNVRAGAYGDQATIVNKAAKNWLTYRNANAA